MTLEEAVEFFKQKKGNCCQAIVAMYNDKHKLSNIDHDTCMKLTSAYGGGIANTGNICGALNGALLILGLKYAVLDTKKDSMEQRMKVINLSQKLFDEFKQMNGSILCKELINHDLKTQEDIQNAFESGAFDQCSKYVEDTSKILDTLL